MTQDEHDAKCWRMLKQTVVETTPKMSFEAKAIAMQFQDLLVRVEVYVDQGAK